jgi:DNA-directed RNA polymerase subunit F
MEDVLYGDCGEGYVFNEKSGRCILSGNLGNQPVNVTISKQQMKSPEKTIKEVVKQVAATGKQQIQNVKQQQKQTITQLIQIKKSSPNQKQQIDKEIRKVDNETLQKILEIQKETSDLIKHMLANMNKIISQEKYSLKLSPIKKSSSEKIPSLNISQTSSKRKPFYLKKSSKKMPSFNILQALSKKRKQLSLKKITAKPFNLTYPKSITTFKAVSPKKGLLLKKSSSEKMPSFKILQTSSKRKPLSLKKSSKKMSSFNISQTSSKRKPLSLKKITAKPFNLTYPKSITTFKAVSPKKGLLLKKSSSKKNSPEWNDDEI